MSVLLHAHQKRASDPITDGCELPLWLLGIELRTSGRAVSAFNGWAISPIATMTTLIREHFIGAGSQYRGLVLYCHGGTQVDMVLDWSWESYIWVCTQQENSDTGTGLSIWNCKDHPQWHTSSNKVTIAPTRPPLLSLSKSESLIIQVCEPTETIPILATTRYLAFTTMMLCLTMGPLSCCQQAKD